MKKLTYEPVRLLEADDQGQFVWRTFKAAWLVGGVLPPDDPLVIGMADENRMGTSWCVLMAPSGKVVVYTTHAGSKGGKIRVFDSFEGMRGAVPEDVIRSAGIRAGVIDRVDPYPEKPLEV